MLKKEDINIMLYNEYIKVKNLLNIYAFYGKETLKPTNGDAMWAIRTELLLNAMCELEDDNKYPISSKLKDLIDFSDNNQSAQKLKNYIINLPGFNQSLGNSQSWDTDTQHNFVAMGLITIPMRNQKPFTEECTFNLNGNYKLRENDTGLYLDVEFDDFVVKLEKRNEFPEKTFRINNTMVDNLTFHELVNMITYANHVKNFSKENIQGTHFLLG